MRDLRHCAVMGYQERETEDLMIQTGESLEDMIIRQMELETLQKAMQSLSEVQRERLHLYFFEGKTLREIAELQGISRNAVWESIQVMLIRMKKFFA